jgi:hypothetical protein
VSCPRCDAPCADCKDLRARLVNIYHLTLNYGEAPAAVLLAIRAASGPGAPAPPPREGSHA